MPAKARARAKGPGLPPCRHRAAGHLPLHRPGHLKSVFRRLASAAAASCSPGSARRTTGSSRGEVTTAGTGARRRPEAWRSVSGRRYGPACLGCGRQEAVVIADDGVGAAESASMVRSAHRRLARWTASPWSMARRGWRSVRSALSLYCSSWVVSAASAPAGADSAANCLAHGVGGQGEDWYDVYTPGCTGHDEPELDPVLVRTGLRAEHHVARRLGSSMRLARCMSRA